MPKADASNSNQRSKRAAPAGNGSSKRSRLAPFLERLADASKLEINKDKPVKDMDASTFYNTAVYFCISREEARLTNIAKASAEEKAENAKQHLHALHRVSSLLKKYNEVVSGPLWSDAVERKHSPRKVKKLLEDKVQALKRHRDNFSILNDDDSIIFDMGIDSDPEYKEYFQNSVWWYHRGMVYKEDPYATKHVHDMTIEQRFDSLKAFLLRSEPLFTTHERKLEHVAKTWARVMCLFASVSDVREVPDNIRSADNETFKIDCNVKASSLSAQFKELYGQSASSMGVDKLESIFQHEPEYRRYMKKRFQDDILEGLTLEPEPFFEKEVSDIKDPFAVKKALVWFIDRNDKRAFDDNSAMARRVAILRDWKRVLALKHRVEKYRNEENVDLEESCDKVMGNPTPSLSIVTQADDRIKGYARKVKDSTASTDAQKQMVDDLAATNDRDSNINDHFKACYTTLLKVK